MKTSGIEWTNSEPDREVDGPNAISTSMANCDPDIKHCDATILTTDLRQVSLYTV